MSEIIITPAQLDSLASAFHAASTDKITPVITAIKLERAGDRINAYGTDRYRLVRISLALKADEKHSDEFSAIVDAKAFHTLARTIIRDTGRPGLNRPSVTLSLPDDTKALTVYSNFGDASATVPVIRGNYPPLERLIPDAEKLSTGDCQGVMLKPAYLATVTKFTLPGLHREQAWKMQRGAATEFAKNPPVLFTVEADGDTVEYLVQPNVLLK